MSDSRRRQRGHPNSVLAHMGSFTKEQKVAFYKKDAASMADMEAMNAWASLGCVSGSCLSGSIHDDEEVDYAESSG